MIGLEWLPVCNHRWYRWFCLSTDLWEEYECDKCGVEDYTGYGETDYDIGVPDRPN